ncbi:MAG: hypothetical protein K8S98_18655 [Planctomycetes bacterium]|nr:hypothetical protein [Planctomycetota bacterium]
MATSLRFLALGSVLTCITLAPAARAQAFQGIGDLAGGTVDSTAFGVSADGSTVVGRSTSALGLEACRWNATGLVGLGDLAGGAFESTAFGANHDGSVIVGTARDASVPRPVRWDGTTLTQLPQVAGHAGYAECQGISANGRTLTSFHSNGTNFGYGSIVAVRIDDGVMTTLPYVPTSTATFDSGAYGQPSEDGRVLAGRVRLGGLDYGACCWVDTTLVHLPKLVGGPTYAQCLAISGNGNVQVGVSCSTASPTYAEGEAVRWENGVVQALGNLPGAARSGYGLSANRGGSIVVGAAKDSTSQLRAFIWDAAHGMRLLSSVLVSDYGLNLTGWTLTGASAITPDGNVIVGSGINPAGFAEGWIARLGCGGFASYCTAGTTTNGCEAHLWASGAPSASGTGSFTLTATNVEGKKPGLFFYGVNGGQALAWGTSSSFLCVKSPTKRFAVQNSGGTAGSCNGVLTTDWNAFLAAHPGALGAPFSAGKQVWVQAWFRDPPSSMNTALSNGLTFFLCP